MLNPICELKLKDFADMFGTTVDDISEKCGSFIEKHDFRYRQIEPEERDKIILNVLKKIETDRQIIGAPDRYNAWQQGWEANLKDFIESGYALEKLVPKFIRPNHALRLKQNYVLPINPNFELDYISVFRIWLFKKYLKNFDAIYEFGCGTGFNLVALSQIYPDKRLYGLDFVMSSVGLVNKVSETHRLNLKSYIFDMASPDDVFELEKNSAVFTFGAIEQLAGKFDAFVKFLLRESPGICIHIEPAIELYDQNNLVDYLAIKFHEKRGYTKNLLPYLQNLECQRKIEILKTKRLFFGSLYMEGYSLIIWRPLTY